MATCLKCGTSLLPNADRCSRCGASASFSPGAPAGGGTGVSNKAMLAVALAGVLATAGMGGAMLFFLSASEPPPPPEEAMPEPPPPPPPAPAAEPPAEAERNPVEAGLRQARAQLAEVQAQAKDDATRERLAAAMKQTEELLAKAKDEPAATPPCDSAQMAKISRENVRGIRACYEKALKRKRKPSGRLELSVKADPHGKVQSVEFAPGAIEDAEVRRCAQMAVQRWTLPPTADGCVGALSYDLKPAP